MLSVLGEEGVSPTLPLHALREKIIASTRNREIIEVLLFIVEVLLKNSLAAAQMFFLSYAGGAHEQNAAFPLSGQTCGERELAYRLSLLKTPPSIKPPLNQK